MERGRRTYFDRDWNRFVLGTDLLHAQRRSRVGLVQLYQPAKQSGSELYRADRSNRCGLYVPDARGSVLSRGYYISRIWRLKVILAKLSNYPKASVGT